MIENFKESREEFKDYDSELLLKILNKTSFETKKSDEKELFVDENRKINSNNMSNIIPSDNLNLKRVLSDIFPNKKYCFLIIKMGRRILCYRSLLNENIIYQNLFIIYCLQKN